MIRYLLFFLVVLFVGCAKSVSKEDLTQLNGYWEIVLVEFPNGQKKEYKVNPSVDYIEVAEMQGFKKKVQPKFDGTYDTSNDAEPFSILEKEGSFLILYENNLSSWEEQLVNLTQDSFSIINEDEITYTYKRFEPINIQ